MIHTGFFGTQFTSMFKKQFNTIVVPKYKSYVILHYLPFFHQGVSPLASLPSAWVVLLSFDFDCASNTAI